MRKNITRSSFILCGVLFLSTAFPALTRADAAKDDQTALFNKVNDLYYNHAKLGLKKYRCQVQMDVFDNFKSKLLAKYGPNDVRLKAVDKVQFLLSYDPKNGMVFDSKGLQSSGDADFDKKADTVVQGLLDLGSKYLNSYQDIVYAPFFELDKFDFGLEKIQDGYRITEIRKNKKEKVYVYLSDQYLAVKFEGDKSDPVAVSGVPGYLQTSQGWLLNSQTLTIKGKDESLDQEMTMEYQMVKNLEMLSILKTSMHITPKLGKPQDIPIKFTFTHYEIN